MMNPGKTALNVNHRSENYLTMLVWFLKAVAFIKLIHVKNLSQKPKVNLRVNQKVNQSQKPELIKSLPVPRHDRSQSQLQNQIKHVKRAALRQEFAEVPLLGLAVQLPD